MVINWDKAESMQEIEQNFAKSYELDFCYAESPNYCFKGNK